MTDKEEAGTLPATAAPKISVLVPAYNTAPYIAESLDSVFAQTFHDYEVIVVNDGSPDTPQLEVVLEPYVHRIKYVKQENHGFSGACNTAIRHSQGELLAFLHSDDIWMPGYLETQVRFLDQNPRVVAAIADAQRFGELGELPAIRKMLHSASGNTFDFDQMIKREAGQLPSATVVRRLKAVEAGLYDEQDEQLYGVEDFEFLYRVLFPDGLAGYLNEVLIKYRMHAASISFSFGEREFALNEARVLRALDRKLPLTPVQRSYVSKEIAALDAQVTMVDAYQHLSNREFDQASACLARANAHYQDTRIKLALGALKIFPAWTARVLMSRWRNRHHSPPPTAGGSDQP